MGKKKVGEDKNDQNLQWFFTTNLTEDFAFQSYAGYFGAYISLIESTSNTNVKEYYINEAVNQFAMIKCRCLIDGVYYKHYANDESLFVSHIMNFYKHLETHLSSNNLPTYISIVNKINSNVGMEYLMSGGVISINHVDNLLRFDIVKRIADSIRPGFTALLHDRKQERINNLKENGLNRLVETGLNKADAEKILEMANNGEDVGNIEEYIDECFVKYEAENDIINNDPVIEDVDVDELLKDWGLQ